ncbi:hypothetical protein E5D57_003818 [Metarhizium anisopliae]|nr:hypothetical protein E5D57_003818 [Metarhizium anisopliae]
MKHTEEYPRCVSKRAKAARPMFVESWRTAVAPYAAAAGRCIIGAYSIEWSVNPTLYNQGEWWRATHEQYVQWVYNTKINQDDSVT